jgi:hypothetical protein
MGLYTSNKAASGVQARAVHAGVNSVVGVYTATAAITAASVIQMVKIPKGATVIAVRTHGYTGAESQGLSVGDGNSSARYNATTSASAATPILHNTIGLGYTYTADDTIDVTVVDLTSATALGFITMAVDYIMDN